MIKFAFGSVPKDAGTFTFYRNLRPILLDYGIDMRCVAVGKAQAQLWEQGYADDGCILLAAHTTNIKKQAMSFVDWCECEQVDVVMGINSDAILSALPHLPERIRVISRCANGFDHGYRITLSGKERLAQIVAITPRLAHDLVEHYGADRSIVRLIPNGIDPKPFEQAASAQRGQQPELRLGFLGRLENNQKGVFHLPGIINELNKNNIPFKLQIAGKGKHRRILEEKMSNKIRIGQVEFLGPLSHRDVPNFLARTDIFIFTSHFEGFGNALLEAMMAGCVPVAGLIEGITDFIIEEGISGFTCRTGDYACFSKRIESLAEDRELLQILSRRVAKSARDRFTHYESASAYANLIQEVMNQPPPKWKPKNWDQFVADPNFKHSWKEFIPDIPLVRWVKEKIQRRHDFEFFAKNANPSNHN